MLPTTEAIRTFRKCTIVHNIGQRKSLWQETSFVVRNSYFLRKVPPVWVSTLEQI